MATTLCGLLPIEKPMRALPWFLLLAVLISNAVWWLALKDPQAPGPPHSLPSRDAGAPPTAPGQDVPSGPDAPQLVGNPAQRPDPAPAAGPAHEAVGARVERLRLALEQGGVDAAASAAHAEIVSILRARSGELLLQTLQMLGGLRLAALDAEALRPPLLAMLREGRGSVPAAAVHALRRVGARPGDVDELLKNANATPDGVVAAQLGYFALQLSERGCSDEVAALFVRLLGVPQADVARVAANLLRGQATPEAVQGAVVAAWERHGPLEPSGGPWFHILGQIVPVRPPLVPALFDILDRFEVYQRERDYTLLTQALKRNVDSTARAEVARRAGLLAERSADEGIRQEALRILLAQGDRAQLDLTRRIAADERLTAATRALAASTGDALSQR